MNEWSLQEDSIKHIPCNSYAYIKNKKLKCKNCNKAIPKYLELPAQVFGAYRHESTIDSFSDLLLKLYSPENIKELENNFTLPLLERFK